MLGADTMSTREVNIALLSTIPETAQPFNPLTAEQIYAELAESRACYERGEYEDFDDALDEISEKYGL